jgi:dipeptidyl-peptidase-4
MLRRSAVVLTVAGFCLSSQYLAGSEELNQRLHRLFATNDLKEKSFGPARWTKGGSAYTTVEPSKAVPGAKDIIEYETESGKRSVLISAAQLKPPKGENALAIEDYQWDKDAKRLLIFTESKKVWRTNTRGDYWVLDREKNSLKKIGGDAPASSLMFAKFSPDGTQVAYVRANNLYVQDLNTDAIRELTPDGSETVVNGASDWVYEEELSVRDGFRWSPDSRSIAFWQFDQSGVQMFTLMNNTDDLYPKLTKFPYPKAGTKNSAVRVGVVDAAGGAPRWMQVPGDAREHYIFRIDWVENELAIGQLNRKQNTATVFLANPQTGSTKPIFEDHDEAWVDVRENGISGYDDRHSRWLNDHKGFVWMSERDGWDRAYLVPRSGGQKEPITTAAADVIAMEALDPDGKWIYFIASPENATQRYLFRSSIDRPGPAVQLSPANMPGTHSYDISPDCRWAFHRYSRFDRPVSIDLISLPDHKTVRMLEGNDLLRANTASLVEPPVEFLQLALADGFTVDGLLLKPRNFDASKKYPLVIYVYGEPASTTVRDAWSGTNSLFLRALANDGYLVASFDNRGTPAPKGRAWRKAVYGSVGVISSMEQTQAVYALAKQRDYVDLNRVGVWGWSGGGANTLNQMFRSPDLYRVGVAVAPVPDQKLYDTIYQERYMGLPAENADGYRAGSPINFVDGLRGKLLVVHGSGDDNVHFQGTQRLINRLVELGKPFDFMEYPNRTHSISEGSGTSLHVYSLIARYFEEHLPAGPR